VKTFFFKAVSSVFENVINDSNEPPAIRNEAINALAMLCFVGCTDQEGTYSIMNLFKGLFDTHDLASNALQAWGLLLTTSDIVHVCDDVIPDSLSVITAFLSDPDVNIRIAAGENIALLLEFQRTHVEDADVFSLGGIIDVEEMISKLTGLAKEKDRHQSKKGQSKQRSIFKDLLRSINDGEPPSISLAFKNFKVDFTSWKQVKQLDFFRISLAGGLQTHFEENELLREIFEFEANKNPHSNVEKLSKIEKRLKMSPCSQLNKSRSKGRGKERSNKANSRILHE